MKDQHLSDEAVAACADGYLTGIARDRAARHIASCAECAAAVQTQREAVWALRAAPAPALPTNLLDRLRAVPLTTPISPLPTAIGPDGTTVLTTSIAESFTTPDPGMFAPMAALVAPPPKRRGRPLITGAAVVALTGALVAAPATGPATAAIGDTGHAERERTSSSTTDPGHANRAPAGITPVSVFRTIGP